MRSWPSAVVGVLVSVWIAHAQSAPPSLLSQAERCASAKRVALGKNVVAATRCYTRAKVLGAAVDSNCLLHNQGMLFQKFSKLSGCPGDALNAVALVGNCVRQLVADVPGNGACPVKSLKAGANATNKGAQLAAKDIRSPGSFVGQIPGLLNGFNAGLSFAGNCGQSPDMGTHVISDCATPILTEFTPTSTTTSTSTSSSTSTTESTSTTTSTTSPCGFHSFLFQMTSTAGDTTTIADWPGGTDTQCDGSCCVTVSRPNGDVSTPPGLAAPWAVASVTGYGSCSLAAATPDCSDLSVSLPSVVGNRPICTSGLCVFCTGFGHDNAVVSCFP